MLIAKEFIGHKNLYKPFFTNLFMEIKILDESKDSIEFEIDSLTLAEILRVYLNQDSSVDFAAWKQDHPTKSPVLKVVTKGKTAKKAVGDAVSAITKDLDRVGKDFEKLK